MTEEEKKKLSPLQIGCGALASVTSMAIGSFFGDGGTILGAALSSITYSVGAFVYEDRARRTHARIKARKERGKSPGDEFHRHLEDLPLERSLNAARTREYLRRDWNLPRRLAILGGMLALCLGTAAVTLIGVEGITGKTLTSNVTGRAQYGTTLGGYTTHSPSPAPPSPSSQSPSVIPSVTLSGSPEGSPDASPDASPDFSPSSPSVISSPATPLPSGQIP